MINLRTMKPLTPQEASSVDKGTPIPTNTVNTALSECRENGTCGQGVNDYLQKLGDKRIF